MKNISLWITKNKNKAWFALGLNLAVMAGIFILMMPFYETNDDLTICEFIDGSYGAADAHLIFQNYALGMIFKFLYTLPGNLPWYALFQYFVLWLSFSAVTYVVMQKLDTFAGLSVMAVVWIYFAYEGYVKMQFSKVSGIASGAGLFLLLYAVTRERLVWQQLLSGWIIGCLGVVYRFDEFLVCAALMTGIGVFLVLELKYLPKGTRWKKFGTYVAVFGTMLTLAVGLKVFDNYMYSDEFWTYYDRYNDLRCELQDYGFPDYWSNEEIFNRVGIDKDAYQLFSRWNINDPENFTADVMEQLTPLQQRNQLNKELVARYFKEIPIRFFELHIFYGFLIFLAFWAIWGKRSLSVVLALLYEVVMFGAVYFFLFYTGRYLINRVDVGLWFTAALVLIWMLEPTKMKWGASNCGVLCLCVFLMNQSVWSNDWRFDSVYSLQSRARERSILETFSVDKDHLYLAKINTLSGGHSFGPFDRVPEGILDNICWMGGWETNTALNVQLLANWGVTNPYKDMINNPRVYIIDDDIELTLRFLHTYYDETATAELVKDVEGLKVYQISGGIDENNSNVEE